LPLLAALTQKGAPHLALSITTLPTGKKEVGEHVFCLLDRVPCIREHVKGGQGIVVCPYFSKEPGTGCPLFVYANNLEEVVAVVETAINVLTTQELAPYTIDLDVQLDAEHVCTEHVLQLGKFLDGCFDVHREHRFRNYPIEARLECVRTTSSSAVSRDATKTDTIAPTATGTSAPAPTGSITTMTASGGGAPAAKRPRPLAETTPTATTRDSTL
jgi:hypothetical protein